MAGVVQAVVCRILEGGDVPAVYKVTVEPITSGVAIGEDKRLLSAIPPREVDCVIYDLEEDRDHVYGMRSRTRSVVVCDRLWVRHV